MGYVGRMATMTWQQRTIDRPDGVQLAVWVRDPADDARSAATVVLVHGYPDSHVMWDPLVEQVDPQLRLVAMDVRGAGASTAPGEVAGYDLERLADDIAAVCRFTSPDGTAHVVGHDWGGIAGFEAATLPRTAKALRSLTAISAASLDHSGRWMRRRLRPSAGWPSDLLAVAGQLRRSWYIGAFQLPGAPRLMAGVGRAVADRLDDLGPGTRPVAPTAAVDAANGVGLYRANTGRVRSPRRGEVLVPLQVVLGNADPFISTRLHDDLQRYAPGAPLHLLAGGHWLPVTQAPAVADLIEAFVAEVEG